MWACYIGRMSGISRFDRASAELAQLPRAERFERLLDFPNEFTFKAIGKGEDFWRHVRTVLDETGYPDVIVLERPSARGRYCSITFKINVESGETIDRIYRSLELIPTLVYLL